MPGTVLLMQSILLGQRKVMQIRQRETLSHQRAIIHEVCLSSAQYTRTTVNTVGNYMVSALRVYMSRHFYGDGSIGQIGHINYEQTQPIWIVHR